MVSLIVMLAMLLLSGCRTLGDTIFDTGRGAVRGIAGLQRGHVEVADQSIAYLHRGGQGPVIVMLHGFASEKDVWLRFVRKLPRDQAVIAFDLPGHGESSRNPELVYNIAGMLDTLEQALVILVDEPFHLVGTSLGGMLATFYTAANMERVQSLALYAPAGVYPPRPSDFQLALDRGENPLIATDKASFRQLVDIVFYDPPPLVWPIGPAIRRYSISRAPFHQKIWNDLWPDHPTVDKVFPSIACPVLLVWGQEDRVLDVSSVEVFERLLPGISTKIVAGMGHATIAEKPSEMAALLREFTTSVE